jgi:TonB family protein
MIALIVEAALRSLSLGVVVWLAMLALRPRNPHLQKTVWITVLLASLAMPFVLKARMAPSFDVPTSVVTLTQSVTGRAGVAHAATWHSLPGAFTILYLLVAVALLARLAMGLFSIWRIRRAAVPLPNPDGLDIRVSPRITSPATFGFTILLPASSVEWNDSTLEVILTHERSHVRCWDCYVQWLTRLHACVFWFNPLAWWLNRRLTDLAETTSDDAVVAAMPDRTAYADLLLEIARHPAPAMVTSAARSNISARIERIISDIPPALPPRRWVRGVAALALIPLFVLAAATAQSPPQATRRSAGPAGSDDSMAPKMVSWSTDDSNYPVEAKRRGIEGLVTVNASIDENGVVTYVQVVEQDPAVDDYGLADGAIRAAKLVRFSNPTHQPRQVRFRVKFELADKHLRDALPAAPLPAALFKPRPPH